MSFGCRKNDVVQAYHRQSNGVFAAFKVHSMAEKMAALLTDDAGKLKPFYQWKNEVQDIATHYVGPWLRTEYNTAVIRAHNAADWLQFERNRDIMPNLRWMPTTSPNPEAEHRRFWAMKLTRPIDDPFWNKHRPGDRWNCKCSLEATDEPITDLPDDAGDEKPQRGLRGNPAKTGQIFDKSHPYFPKNCASCGFNRKKGTITSRLRGWFNAEKMDCGHCKGLIRKFPNDEWTERVKAYKELKNNPEYKDVEFDVATAGVRATHKEHNFDAKKGYYETMVQDVGYKSGHKVILEKEVHNIYKKRNTEGTWDGMLFEIGAAENATEDNIRNALKHCASKPGAEVAVIFFPEKPFDAAAFERGYSRFRGLKGTTQYRKFKFIYCIDKDRILSIKKPK